MYTVTFDTITANAGEPIEITAAVTDKDGTAINVSVGFTARLRVSRLAGMAHIVEKTQGAGIILSTNKVIATFNTGELLNAGAQMFDDFHVDIMISNGVDELYIAKGTVTVEKVNT